MGFELEKQIHSQWKHKLFIEQKIDFKLYLRNRWQAQTTKVRILDAINKQAAEEKPWGMESDTSPDCEMNINRCSE